MNFVEEWSDIPGFPNYAVSDYGRVLNTKRNYLLKNTLYSNGYLYVSLGRLGKNTSVHRLVAQMFIQSDLEDLEVNHLDGNKLNNHVSNLEVTTAVDNMMHAHRIGLFPESFRFSPRSVVVLETGDVFESVSSLARYLGVSPQAVDQAVKRGSLVKGYHVERVTQ